MSAHRNLTGLAGDMGIGDPMPAGHHPTYGCD